MREFEFIDWICRQGRFDPAVVEVGPGDDCAVLNLGGEKLLLTTDQALDGVHFLLTEHGAEAAGRKAAARALSDVAAMAGQPLAMAATVAAPKGLSRADAEAIYRGLRSAGDAFACPLVGGDVAAWAEPPGGLQITVTVLGSCGGVGPVLRSGAKPGDAVCVTGALGGAWRGRRHLTFTPRIAEARGLAGEFGLHAMIDVSDGLAADLGHIAAASCVAAELDAAAVPIHDDARACDDPLSAALRDGEDYELLFTLPAEQARRLVATQPLAVRVSRIGTIAAGAGMTLLRGGKSQKLPPRGWEHRT
jgi:thiamine-monophosphate kinase